MVFVESCMDACVAAEKGYAAAAAHVTDPTLRAFCAARSAERARFAAMLHVAVEQLGVGELSRGAFRAAARRDWIDVRGALATRGDHGLLLDCARNEREAQRLYTIARHEAAKIGAPVGLRDVLDAQDGALESARAHIATCLQSWPV